MPKVCATSTCRRRRSGCGKRCMLSRDPPKSGHRFSEMDHAKEDKRVTSWTAPNDPLGAFCRENHIAVKGAGAGPLAGSTFAAKDAFHIAGARTGFGQPDW